MRLFGLLEGASSTLRYHAPCAGFTVSPSLFLPSLPDEKLNSSPKSRESDLYVCIRKLGLRIDAKDIDLQSSVDRMERHTCYGRPPWSLSACAIKSPVGYGTHIRAPIR